MCILTSVLCISVINKKYLNLYKNELNKAKNNEISKFTAKKANTLMVCSTIKV
jgi:hypothetical protein